MFQSFRLPWYKGRNRKRTLTPAIPPDDRTGAGGLDVAEGLADEVVEEVVVDEEEEEEEDVDVDVDAEPVALALPVTIPLACKSAYTAQSGESASGQVGS